MKKEEFLEIISNYSREDFKKYLYRYINKKQKLIDGITTIDANSMAQSIYSDKDSKNK